MPRFKIEVEDKFNLELAFLAPEAYRLNSRGAQVRGKPPGRIGDGFWCLRRLKIEVLTKKIEKFIIEEDLVVFGFRIRLTLKLEINFPLMVLFPF